MTEKSPDPKNTPPALRPPSGRPARRRTTTAILDPLFDKSHIFNIDGLNFRLRNLNIRLKAHAEEED
jgi:hypothetical protein